MITVLTGGTGGAKFVDGLRQIVPAEELMIVVNTGDDIVWWGLYISPDIDSIAYMLADKLSQERGFGVKGDTLFCLGAMEQLGQPAWFRVGDRDLATHILSSGRNCWLKAKRWLRPLPKSCRGWVCGRGFCR